MKTRILVTGASGMVGRAVLREFADQEVIAPTRGQLDLQDARATQAFMSRHRPDVVIHLAARVGGIQANMSDPVGFLLDNQQMNSSVISSALNSGVEEFLFLGSSCMYPRGRSRPLKEEDLLSGRLEPTNEGYALSKIMGARLCEYVSSQYGYAYRTAIPPNLYGPYDHFEVDRSHLVAAVIRKVQEATLTGAKTVEVWGDGKARREFMYVDDVARFVSYALKHVGLRNLPAILNVGVQEDHTVLEYYHMIADLLDYDGEFVTDLDRPSGMRRKLLDSSKAFALGWRPRIGLSEGLRATIAHFLKEKSGHTESRG